MAEEKLKNVWAEKNVFGLKRELFWAEKKGTREPKEKKRRAEAKVRG